MVFWTTRFYVFMNRDTCPETNLGSWEGSNPGPASPDFFLDMHLSLDLQTKSISSLFDKRAYTSRNIFRSTSWPLNLDVPLFIKHIIHPNMEYYHNLISNTSYQIPMNIYPWLFCSAFLKISHQWLMEFYSTFLKISCQRLVEYNNNKYK